LILLPITWNKKSKISAGPSPPSRIYCCLAQRFHVSIKVYRGFYRVKGRNYDGTHLRSVYTFRIKWMRYFIIFLLSFLSLSSDCFSILRIGRETKENNVGFQTKRLHVSDEGRYDRVKEILNTHEDSETLIEAIKEVLDISRNNSKNDDALQLIQSVVSRADPNSSVYRRAKLAEARLLLRIDKKRKHLKFSVKGLKKNGRKILFGK
jgi:hypothetical protein